jgi:hypothetical protein
MTPMKRILIPSLIGIAAIALLTGCDCDVKFGGGSTTRVYPATVGQQLVDLKKAKDSGAITQEEYDAQKSKVLAAKQ